MATSLSHRRNSQKLNFLIFFEYESIKNNLIKYKCLSFNKYYSNKLLKNWKSDSKTPLRFFVMILIKLREAVYSYDYIDKW